MSEIVQFPPVGKPQAVAVVWDGNFDGRGIKRGIARAVGGDGGEDVRAPGGRSPTSRVGTAGGAGADEGGIDIVFDAGDGATVSLALAVRVMEVPKATVALLLGVAIDTVGCGVTALALNPGTANAVA